LLELEYEAAGEELPESKASFEGALENMGLGEKEDKPFWAKFLSHDYQKEVDSGPMLSNVMDVLEGNKKLEDIINPGDDDEGRIEVYTGPSNDPRIDYGMGQNEDYDDDEDRPETEEERLQKEKVSKEWAKICRLEQRLGMANKA